jgi:HrpA-like RNA helicase
MSLVAYKSFWREDLLETPKEEAIQDAETELLQLGALTAEGELTPLGYHLSFLPLDARVGKLLLFGAIFGCPAPISIVAAILETKSVFVTPYGLEKDVAAKRGQFHTGNSDLLTDLAAYRAWSALNSSDQERFCTTHFLNRATLREIRKLAESFEKLLVSLGFLPSSYWTHAAVFEVANRHEKATAVVAAVISAGLYPNIIVIDEQQERGLLERNIHRRFWDKTKQVYIHPSSVNYGPNVEFQSPWLGYHFKLYTSRMYVPISSSITPFALAMFGGQFEFDFELNHVLIDKWIKIPCAGRTAMLLFELRKCLSNMLQRKNYFQV